MTGSLFSNPVLRRVLFCVDKCVSELPRSCQLGVTQQDSRALKEKVVWLWVVSEHKRLVHPRGDFHVSIPLWPFPNGRSVLLPEKRTFTFLNMRHKERRL